MAGALVLNIGTLSPPWIEAMVKAGKRANALHIPVILDPVGAGATTLRTHSAKRLIEEVSIQVIRGNASEVLSLSREKPGSRTKGVHVTGTGCTATAIIGAFRAVEPDSLKAATTGLAYFGLAGEKAAARSSGPGTFQIALLDALYDMKEEELRAGARIQVGCRKVEGSI